MKNNLETSALLDVYNASVRIIKSNQADSGAYVASPNFGQYNYSWFRDGSFIANSMVQVGEIESARNFHAWAGSVINKRSEKIQSLIERNQRSEKIEVEEHLDCRYTVEGEEGAEFWTNLQLDGFGAWLWSLDEFLKIAGPLDAEILAAADLIAEYISEFWGIESFDWWEESFGHQHVSTLGSIAVGLLRHSQWQWVEPERRAISKMESSRVSDLINQNGQIDGRLVKWIDGQGLDASLLSLFEPFEFLDARSDIGRTTIAAIAAQLGTFGTYRHAEDDYYGGGRWPLLSCFLGLCYVELGDFAGALEILRWVAGTANQANELPEQIDGNLLHPSSRRDWIEKWGEPAIPLLWSHAMFLHLYATLNRFGVEL